MRNRRVVAVVGTAAVVSVIGVIGAIAATSSGAASTTVFQACLNTKAQTLVHVTTSAVAPQCGKHARLVSWNAKGVDGATVLSGAGSPGAGLGKAGDFYVDVTGWLIYGPRTSSAWPSGHALTGPAGTNGTNGAAGQNGTNGIDGSSVLSGACSTPSERPTPCPTVDGALGDFFIDTTNWRIFGPLTADGWGTPTSITGPKGDDGADGSSVLSGACAVDSGWNRQPTDAVEADCPPAGTGHLGDFFIDTTNSRIFGPLTGDGWGNPTSLVGPKGDDGSDGTDGADGSSVLSGACAVDSGWNRTSNGSVEADCPPAGTGHNGDFFIDTTNWRIFGPLTSNGWGDPTSIIGPAGGPAITDVTDLDGLTCATAGGSPGIVTTSVDNDNHVSMVCQPDSP